MILAQEVPSAESHISRVLILDDTKTLLSWDAWLGKLLLVLEHFLVLESMLHDQVQVSAILGRDLR